jgi:mRNA interferase HigB
LRKNFCTEGLKEIKTNFKGNTSYLHCPSKGCLLKRSNHVVLTCLQNANYNDGMNVINRTAVERAKKKHPECAQWLDRWYFASSRATWTRLADVRLQFASADQVGGCLVFDATHARRLIVGVRYARGPQTGTVYFKHFLTHEEYDRNNWKSDCRWKS